jgi:hypothetical protein
MVGRLVEDGRQMIEIDRETSFRKIDIQPRPSVVATSHAEQLQMSAERYAR